MSTAQVLALVLRATSDSRRWSLLTVCVVDDRRTMANEATAPLVLTLATWPYCTLAGAAVIAGRVAALPSGLNR